MTAVERVRVGDVLALQRRPVNVEPDEEYIEIGVRSFGRGIFHKDPVDGATLGRKRVFAIEPGDLVISNVFAWEGAIAVGSDAESGLIGSHRFMTFVPVDGRIDTSWAAWFFQSEPGLELLRRASPGSAGRNRTLAMRRFEALEVPLPPLTAQRVDAARLEAMQLAARRASSQIAGTDADDFVAMLPSFTDDLVARQNLRSAPMSELVDFVSDTVHPGQDPKPATRFVGLQHIARHTGQQIGSDSLVDQKGRKFRFQPGDVIYGYLRPYLNKVWVADRHGLCSVDQYVLRPRPNVSADLLGYVLRGRRVLDSAIELTHSLQLPRLRSALLSAMVVPFAPPAAAEGIVKRLDRVRDQVISASDKRARQAKAVDALVAAALHENFKKFS